MLPAFGNDTSWHTDLAEAQKAAKKEGKPILMNFSGSDWCGWCIRLDKEVFSKDIFKDYAKKNLVLLTLDFPRKSPQAPELKKQNKGLAQKYKIQGFPTIIVVSAEGKILLHTGYRKGGSAAYVDYLKNNIKKDS